MKKLLLSLSLICIFVSHGCKKETISYVDIAVLVEKAYKNLTSYRDTGIVSAFYESNFSYTTTKRFKTAFKNDGRFRFEYKDDGNDENHYIIHQDISKTVQSWWGISAQVNDEADIFDALTSASGLTDMTAYIVPSFLFPVEFESDNTFWTLADLYLETDDIVDGEPCYVIAGYDLFNDLCKIYIQKNNYLIRRFTDGHQYETFNFTRTIDFYPEINVPVSDGELLFNTP